MKNLLQKIWAWFSGKKRVIALVYWTVVTPCLPILWPAGIPGDVNKVYLITGIVLSALGLGHAALKNYMEGKATVVDTTVPPDAPAQ